MKLSVKWLLRHLNISNIEIKEELLIGEIDNFINSIEKTLTSLGLPVDDLIILNPLYEGNILSFEKVSEKLNYCQVYVDYLKKTFSIICSSDEVKEGRKVVVAISPTVLRGHKIEDKVIRGYKSEGMICSEKEIFNNGSNSIYFDSHRIFSCEDIIFTLNVNLNRNDLRSVYGIARELSFKGFGQLKIIKHRIGKEPIKIEVKNTTNVDFSYMRVKDFILPKEIDELLSSIGKKSSNSLQSFNDFIITDISYPIHIYSGQQESLKIRFSKGEIVNTIKGEYFSQEGEIIVEDKEVLAVAGIIGCSEYPSTEDIIIESAQLNPSNIKRIISDSSKAFWTGIDYNFSVLSYIGYLLKDSEISQIYCSTPPTLNDFQNKSIFLSFKDFYSISGIDIPLEQINKKLKSFAFESKIVRKKRDININDEFGLEVIAPSWRRDIKIVEDIVEEILRIIGYDQLLKGETNLSFNKHLNFFSKSHHLRERLTSLGFSEVYSIPFTDKGEIKIKNPLSNKEFLRDSLIYSLLEWGKKSLKNSWNIKIFEVGKIYKKEGEKEVLGILMGGKTNRHWYSPSIVYSLENIKEIFFQLFDNTLFLTEIDIDILKGRGNGDCLYGSLSKQTKMPPLFYCQIPLELLDINKNFINDGIYHYYDISIEGKEEWKYIEVKISEKLSSIGLNFSINLFDVFKKEDKLIYSITIGTNKLIDIDLIKNLLDNLN